MLYDNTCMNFGYIFVKEKRNSRRFQDKFKISREVQEEDEKGFYVLSTNEIYTFNIPLTKR